MSSSTIPLSLISHSNSSVVKIPVFTAKVNKPAATLERTPSGAFSTTNNVKHYNEKVEEQVLRISDNFIDVFFVCLLCV